MDMEKQGRSNLEKVKSDEDRNGVRVKRKTLETVLEQCQRALEMLNDKGFIDDEENDDDDDKSIDEANNSLDSCSASVSGDEETDELCNLLKSRVACPDFLEKIESAQTSTQQNLADSEMGSSWDVVNKKDLWESGSFELDKEDYVYVKEEDIVDGMACFMAAYLQSIKQTKDLSPTQLQEALSKTLNVKKKKGKLQKAWDGSKVIYNVASWGATAVGIYQNPAILKVASAAFWTSCHVISKLF